MSCEIDSTTVADRDEQYCSILNRELVCALGCTEPIAVAYAAAIARETLGSEPEHLELECSGNIIKNVKSVTVPNSGGMHGLEAAATFGAVGGNPENALEVLESVDDAARARTAELLADPAFADVSLAENVPNLYIRVKPRQTTIPPTSLSPTTIPTWSGAPLTTRSSPAPGTRPSALPRWPIPPARREVRYPLRASSILRSMEKSRARERCSSARWS